MPRPVRPQTNVPLHDRCTLEVGGKAQFFVEATSEAEMIAGLGWAAERSLPVHVLGGGSNVVIADAALPGLVLKIANRGVTSKSVGDSGVEVTAAAGENWDAFVAHCVARGWSGVECLSGIPGLVGATPVQNVGAYGQQVSDTLVRVRAYDRVDEEIKTLPASACSFAYRNSAFKSRSPGRYVVLDVTFRLATGDPPPVDYAELARKLADSGTPATCQTVRDTVIELRRNKSMVLDANDPNRRSCGSFFLNPIVERATFEDVAKRCPDERVPHWPSGKEGGSGDTRVKLSAGWLIEHAGLAKGALFAAGTVGLSSRHALAIVCHDGATADAVVEFAKTVRARVRERFEVTLNPEPNFWGFDANDLGSLLGELAER